MTQFHPKSLRCWKRFCKNEFTFQVMDTVVADTMATEVAVIMAMEVDIMEAATTAMVTDIMAKN